ncbi:alpha/beta hydrolase family protein [Rhodococcus sp. NM-2]|uniref:alpha/beta hydrolase family protein n=1 Tax=Rhodococcus sp. NM-2 TaxID=3401174 RepID=UPI003AAAEC57
MKATLILRGLVAGAVVFGAVASVQPATASADTGTLLRLPASDSNVGVSTLELVDHDRDDPWTPGRARSIPVTVTYPAGFAAGGTRSLPVILFSPGFYVPRTLYTIAAEDLASRGYVVIGMDHTGEALATVFPDGRVVTSQITDPYSAETQKKALDTRVEDASFVVDTVESLSRGDDPDGIGRLLPDGLSEAVDPERIGMFGHSIGGATTTQVLLDDPRVDAGVNVDGALLYANTASPIVSQDPGTPLLSVLNSRHAESPEGRDRFWGLYFATPRSWSKVYALRDTGHFSFTDAEHYVPQAIPDPPGMDVPAGFSLGTAPRQEVVDTTNHLVAGMFDRFLKEAPAPELDDAASRYPLVFEVR